MTTNANWKQYENTPPPNNPAVAKIMAERGIGRRKAYAAYRREQAKSIDTRDVRPSQRLAVMAVLVNDVGARRTVPDLVASLHRVGTKIDGHDTVKTLWALQKQDWVGFREKAHGDLYAITIKPAGFEGYEKLARERQENGINHAIAAVEEARREPEPGTFAYSVMTVPEVPVQTDIIDEPIEEPVVTQTSVYDRLPLITDLIARGKKADQLNAAAKILEEAGEDDLAIQIYAKSGISPLEGEVLQLIHWIEEGSI